MKIHTTVIALMICSLYSGPDWAHGGSHSGGHRGYGGYYSGGFRGGYVGRSSFGFYWGFPNYSDPYFSYPRYGYAYPYYYPPAVITLPTRPPAYIQQTPSDSRQYPVGYWYYCTAPEGYYPYVKECPNGWRQVDPTPPASR